MPNQISRAALLVTALLLGAQGLPSLAQSSAGGAPAATPQASAAELLERARLAHGGAALSSLRGAQLHLQFYSPGYGGVYDRRDWLDFAGERGMMRYYGPDGPASVELLSGATRTSGWNWDWDKSVLETVSEAGDLRRSDAVWHLYFGVLGLRLTAAQRQSVTAQPEETWLGLRGTPVQVTSGGVSLTLLLGPDGTLLADRLPSGDTTVYSDFRVVDGVRFPFTFRFYDPAKQLTTYGRVLELRLNPSFTAADFTLNPQPYPAWPYTGRTFGFMSRPADPEQLTGMVIYDTPAIVPDSPAGRAGLRAGDVVLSMNGQPAEGQLYNDLRSRLRSTERLTLEVRRAGETAPLTFTMVRPPAK